MGKQFLSERMEYIQQNGSQLKIKFRDCTSRIYHSVPETLIACMVYTANIDQFFADHVENKFEWENI